jgi:CBS domain-containing protein
MLNIDRQGEKPMASPYADYRPLTLASLAPATEIAPSFYSAPAPVKVSSYALEVMTDLRFIPAATVEPGAGLEAALGLMIARGVRLLLVKDEDERLAGLITARDIEGPRPKEIEAREGIAHADLTVARVMTPAAEIEVLPMEEVLHARVGNIITTLKHSWRQHALVVEALPDRERPLLRGVFSASQIARQLGIALSDFELSHTFADIDRAISGQEASLAS